LKFKPLFIFIIFIASCTGADKHKGNLKIFHYNESAGITSLDPAFAKDQANIWACNQLFNGLVQLDDNLNVLPCIAKSWKISDDGLTYTFNLRQDVYFHENRAFKDAKGRKVTASDFVYSFNRIVDPKVASPGAWVFSNVKRFQDIKLSVIAINDSTLKIELKEPFTPFLGILSMQYCSVVQRKL